jgi:anthranilate synthase component 2
VQFHPESIVSEYGFDILKNFLQEAKLSYNRV